MDCPRTFFRGLSPWWTVPATCSRPVLAVVGFVLVHNDLLAQVITGRLVGTVREETGAVPPGATITLSSATAILRLAGVEEAVLVRGESSSIDTHEAAHSCLRCTRREFDQVAGMAAHYQRGPFRTPTTGDRSSCSVRWRRLTPVSPQICLISINALHHELAGNM